MTKAGPLDLIDDNDSDTAEGIDKQTQGKLGLDLPGSVPYCGRPVIRIKCLKISPTGRSFSAATTKGVLVYSMDESFVFDPTDLDIDVTPEEVGLPKVQCLELQTTSALTYFGLNRPLGNVSWCLRLAASTLSLVSMAEKNEYQIK
ncbi:Periodic tryptophan protein 2 [Bienertia sinuspersici]